MPTLRFYWPLFDKRWRSSPFASAQRDELADRRVLFNIHYGKDDQP